MRLCCVMNTEELCAVSLFLDEAHTHPADRRLFLRSI